MGRTLNFLSISEQNLLRTMFLGSRLSSGGVHVLKKYKTRVGDRQRKSGYCGMLAHKVSVRPYARINYAPLSNLTMYTTGFKLNTAYAVNLCTRFLNLLSTIIRQFEMGLLTELSRL